MPLTTEQLRQKYQGGASSTPSTGLTSEQLKQKYSGGTPSAPVQPTPLTEDQRVLQETKVRKSEKDRLDLQKQSERTGLGKGYGVLQDLWTGLANSGERGVGNTITFGNEMLQKLGFEGSSNPRINWDTESNKYAYGEGTAGTNPTQKVGGFAGDVGQVLAPTPFGKLGLTGRTGNIAKAITEGIQGDVLLSGNIDPLTTLGLGGLSGALSKGTKAIQGQKELVKAYELKGAGNIEEGQKAHQSYLKSVGIDTPEKLAEAQKLELENFDNLLKSSTNLASSQLDLVNMPKESKEIVLQHLVYAKNPKTGKTDLTKTLQNLKDEKDRVYDEIEDVAGLLNTPGTLSSDATSISANSPLIRRIDETINNTFLGASDGKTPEKLDANKIREHVYDLLQPDKRNQVSFDELNRIRKKANKSSDPDVKTAARVVADAFRSQLELEVNILDDKLSKGFLDKESVLNAEAIDRFRDLNRRYGLFKDAEVLTDALGKAKLGGDSRFEQMIGGVIATGGGYDPTLYIVGSEAAKKARDVYNAFSGRMMGASSGATLKNTNPSNALKNWLNSMPKKKSIDQTLREEAGLQ